MIHVSAKLTKNVDFVYLISQPITIAIYESDKCNKERSIIGDIRKMNKKNIDFFLSHLSACYNSCLWKWQR